MTTWADYISCARLRHFKPHEWLVNTDHPLNEIPPMRLWQNIVPTAVVLDVLREHYGRPIRATSCYRNDAYNRHVGGVPLSNHRAFTAADFVVLGVPQREVAELLRSWRGRWFRVEMQVVRDPLRDGTPFARLEWSEDFTRFKFAGGVGSYSTFCHLDTRGLNHTWRGR